MLKVIEHAIIECDGPECPETTGGTESADEAIQEAHRLHWSIEGAKFYCPRCAEQNGQDLASAPQAPASGSQAAPDPFQALARQQLRILEQCSAEAHLELDQANAQLKRAEEHLGRIRAQIEALKGYLDPSPAIPF